MPNTISMYATVLHIIFAFILLLILLATGRAMEPDERLQDDMLERRARILSTQLRCMVCQNQSIDNSDAPLAKDLRLLVRKRLLAGDSDDAVLAYLVDRYGEFVLLKPEFNRRTFLLWLMPFLFLCAGAGFVLMTFFYARKAEDSNVPEDKA